MGTLAHFNLPGIIARYGVKHFVETGTGTGDSLALAAAAPFTTLHSIEVVPALAQSARARFSRDERIRIYEGDSVRTLGVVLEKIPQDEPVLFWLDAHFAGADYGLASYDSIADVRSRLPLEDELLEIVTRRLAVEKDVVFMDDARVYQPGPYSGGDLPPDFPGLKGVKRSLQFVRDMFERTHGIVVDYASTGFVMVCPRLTYDRVNGG